MTETEEVLNFSEEHGNNLNLEAVMDHLGSFVGNPYFRIRDHQGHLCRVTRIYKDGNFLQMEIALSEEGLETTADEIEEG